MSIIKIALTGGIACGKSQVAQIFAQLGIDIIRLDDIAKTITTPKSNGLKELVDVFGGKILNQDASLDRIKLRDILLQSKKNQAIIEKILHPKILQKMDEAIKKLKKPLVIIEIPRLSDKNLEHLFDRVIIVNCSQKNQLKRLKKRKNTDEKTANKWIVAQTSQANQLKIAKILPTDIITNNSSMLDLKIQTHKLYHQLKNQQSVSV